MEAALLGRLINPYMENLVYFFLCPLPVDSLNQAAADTLNVVENQVTWSSANETTPTLGNDGSGDLVVYTS